jgi:hypothetical protein
MIKREDIIVDWAPVQGTDQIKATAKVVVSRSELVSNRALEHSGTTQERIKRLIEDKVREDVTRGLYANVEEKRGALWDLINWIQKLDPAATGICSRADLETCCKVLFDLLNHR